MSEQDSEVKAKVEDAPEAKGPAPTAPLDGGSSGVGSAANGGAFLTKERLLAAGILAVAFVVSILISNHSGDVAEEQSTTEGP